jgi:hypothetical protein
VDFWRKRKAYEDKGLILFAAERNICNYFIRVEFLIYGLESAENAFCLGYHGDSWQPSQ